MLPWNNLFLYNRVSLFKNCNLILLDYVAVYENSKGISYIFVDGWIIISEVIFSINRFFKLSLLWMKSNIFPIIYIISLLFSLIFLCKFCFTKITLIFWYNNKSLKMFYKKTRKFSKNSHEKSCIGVYLLIKLKRWGLQLYQKQVFLSNTSVQLTFACSKSTKKTLEKGVKYVQS